MGNYLYFLLILACPLAMFFMMRGMGGMGRSHGGSADGGHGQGGSADGGHATSGHNAGLGYGLNDSGSSLDKLRRQRDDLDRQIEEHEAEGKTPAAGRWR